MWIISSREVNAIHGGKKVIGTHGRQLALYLFSLTEKCNLQQLEVSKTLHKIYVIDKVIKNLLIVTHNCLLSVKHWSVGFFFQQKRRILGAATPQCITQGISFNLLFGTLDTIVLKITEIQSPSLILNIHLSRTKLKKI